MANEQTGTKVPGGLQIDSRWRLVTDSSAFAEGGHDARVYEWIGDGPRQHRVLSDGARVDLVLSDPSDSDRLELAEWIAESIAEGTLRVAGTPGASA
jgi:hypothetical protein